METSSWTDRHVRPLIDGFSTKKSVSVRGFLRLSTCPVLMCPVLPGAPCPPNSVSAAGARHPPAATECRRTDPAHAGPSPQRPPLCPARRRVRHRAPDCVPVHHRGGRGPGRSRAEPCGSGPDSIVQGVRAAGLPPSQERGPCGIRFRSEFQRRPGKHPHHGDLRLGQEGLPLFLFGDSGTGKPHLLIALGTEAATAG